MPVLNKYSVTSLDELDSKIEEIISRDKDENIFLWFVGAVEGEKSWCSDCVKAEPVIDEFLNDLKLKKNCSIITCTVDKILFKSGDNPYAKHKARVKKVPTVLSWGKPERVEEDECMDAELLAMVFADVMVLPEC